MTHTRTEKPEALIFANYRPSEISDDLYQWAIDAEDTIRRQHARILELEASQAQRVPLSDESVQHIKALTEIARMPNAEYVADAHNDAVRYLRGITQEKQG